MHPVRTLLAALLLALACAVTGTAQDAPAAPTVRVIELDSDITPVAADFVEGGIEEAEGEGARAVVIRLDTPGGVLTSTRDIVQAMGESSVPVAVWVGPSGARAASAGAFIAAASDYVGMAPGTNIGSATPITSGGEDLDDKVVNDAAASIAALAQEHGRNAEAYRGMVTSADNLTAEEALDQDVIETIQPTLDDFIGWLDGRPGRDGAPIETAGAQVETDEMGWFDRIVDALGDPNVVFLLLLLGIAGIGFEITNPGAVFPGVIGILALIVAIAGLTHLPVDWIGGILIAIGVGFFVAETQVGGVGLFALAGVVCLALGGVFLFDSDDPGLETSPWIAVAFAVAVGGGFLASARLVRRARRQPVTTGRGAMIGQVGVTREEIGPGGGHVTLNGEIWSARTADGTPVPEGTEVRVVRVRSEDLSLIVEPREG
ncbi:MAG: nodulation protein NfeD [Thermoleophilia bacterium]